MVKKAGSFLLLLSMFFALCIPASAVVSEEHSVSINSGAAILSHKNSSGVTLPVGEVTKVTNIEKSVLINNKYDGPWQETCIDGVIIYCESGAEIKIAEPYSYSKDGSMYEFRFYFGSSKPAEIGRYTDIKLSDSIDTSKYSSAQIKRITGDICLVEYRDFEIDDAGNMESLSTSFEGTYKLPNGTYYVEIIGSEAKTGSDGSSSSVYSYPSAQFVVVVGESSSSDPDAAAFSDVPANAYYSEAVLWAVENGITTGTSENTFSPEDTCTKGQIITFLYRAAGSPAVAGTASVSDAGDTYYTSAVQWAAENGLFSGSAFSPDAPCTREIAVEFMWKYAGSPAAAQANFTDVTSEAVNWAVENGVTNGTSNTTFSPEATCTRGQIVTFLYRAFAD